MADGFDDDMTRCPCCDGEGYFYHGDEPKSPWGDAATIARLTAELAQARADLAASYDRAAAAISDTDALAEIVKRAKADGMREAEAIIREMWASTSAEHSAAILARIDQRKEAGK